MVVVSISAMLLTIGLPSYKGYVLRAHRGDAKAALIRVAQFMERAATANGMYPTAGNVPASVLFVEGNRYAITLISTDGSTFTATATRKLSTPQGTDRCGDFRVDHAGNRTILNAASGMKAADCWNR
jgi:type IV pilus assembly protein PilE